MLGRDHAGGTDRGKVSNGGPNRHRRIAGVLETGTLRETDQVLGFASEWDHEHVIGESAPASPRPSPSPRAGMERGRDRCFDGMGNRVPRGLSVWMARLIFVDVDRDAADAVRRRGTRWGIDAPPLLPQREDEGRGEEGMGKEGCVMTWLLPHPPSRWRAAARQAGPLHPRRRGWRGGASDPSPSRKTGAANEFRARNPRARMRAHGASRGTRPSTRARPGISHPGWSLSRGLARAGNRVLRGPVFPWPASRRGAGGARRGPWLGPSG